MNKPNPQSVSCGPKNYYECGDSLTNRVVNVKERNFNEEITSNHIGCFEMTFNNYTWISKADAFDCSYYCFRSRSLYSVYNLKYFLRKKPFFLD